jgi:hypothetical protein
MMEISTEKWYEKMFEHWGAFVMLACIGLLLAFPLKWTWNYVMPYLFGFPELTWGRAWCLWYVCMSLIKSITK